MVLVFVLLDHLISRAKLKIDFNNAVRFHSVSDNNAIITFNGGSDWTLYNRDEAQRDVNLSIFKYDRDKSLCWFNKNYKCVSVAYKVDGEEKRYIMRSIDGGRKYAFFDVETGRYIDRAYCVTNESLKEAYNWHLLSQYVIRNGRISLDDERGINLLKGSGFTVKEKE